MRRLSARCQPLRLLIACAVVLSACSVDVTTDLVPTPSQSTDERLTAALLGFKATSDKLLAWFYEDIPGPDEVETVAEVREFGLSSQRTANEILDNLDDDIAAIEEFIGSNSSASDADLRWFVTVARRFSAGHRAQNDPASTCIDQIPSQLDSEPASSLSNVPGFVECLSSVISDPLIERTEEAGQELPYAYNTVFLAVSDHAPLPSFQLTDVLSSTTTMTIAKSPMERALIGALHERDVDGVWAGASDELVLRFAYQTCDIAESSADLADSGLATERAGVYVVGSMNYDGATPRDQIRDGSMIAALIAYPLCDPRATAALEDAVAFLIEQAG